MGTGALPPGLTLSALGVISGQVTKDGVFKFTVAVADSGGSQASKSSSITVFKALKVTAKCAQVCVVGRGCAKCGSFGTVSGGQTPYTYKVTGGAVPTGMKQTALSLVGGFPVGTFGLTVQVTDKFGASANVQASWSVYSPATLTAGSNCINANTGTCTITDWSYAGGSTMSAPRVVIVGIKPYCDYNGCVPVPAGPPAGWKASAGAGSLSLSVAVACSTGYEGVLVLALVDSAACPTTSSSNQLDLTVYALNPGC